MVKGTMKYVPKEVVAYLDECKQKFNLKESEAFRQMIKDSKIGKEVRFTIDLNFGRKRR